MFTTKDFEKAIEGSRGSVKFVAERLKCSRQTVYNHLKKNPELQEMLDEERRSMLDVAESKLFQLIDEGHPAAIFFYLKTKGGYREQKGVDINVNVKQYAMVSPDDWDELSEGDVIEGELIGGDT